MSSNINPYYFLLLRRMLEFEVERELNKVPTISAIGEYILKRNGSNKYNISWVERIRRKVLSKTNFNFKKEELDFIAEQLIVFGKFDSWQEFIHFASCSRYAIAASIFDDKDYSSLDVNQRQYLKSLVERTLGFLYSRLVQEGGVDESKHNLPSEEALNFRMALIDDIPRIANLAKRIYPCPINDSGVKLGWFNKNDKIFFICEDKFNELIANINLLPIRASFYNALKDGSVYEDQISVDDILSLDECDDIKYVYIEGLASLSKEALLGLRTRFKRIIFSLIGENKNPQIFSIGGSDEGDAIMSSHGFRHTSWAFDKKHQTKYPFFEISLDELVLNIDRKITSIN